MAVIPEKTLRFLTELESNNNREWFNEHKNDYAEARDMFEQFVETLIRGIASFDHNIGHQSAKESIFRIYRDVRFSHDKSPYKTHFGAFLSPAKSKTEIHSYAGYYIHIEPGNKSMLAGGAYMPQGDWLKSIRKEIFYNSDPFRKILDNKTFRGYFGEIEGEKLKKPPRDYPSDHPEIELLKFKSFTAIHMCSDKLVLSGSFPGHCLEVFESLYPFNHILNDCRQTL